MMVLAATMVGCVSTNQSKPKHVDKSLRLERLVELTDFSERVYSYHQYCVTDGTPIDPRFEDNFKTIVNLLFDEFVQSLRWQPDYALSQIKARRQSIQNQLKKHYAETGCSSPEAGEAKEYYRILSGQTHRSIEEYLAGERSYAPR